MVREALWILLLFGCIAMVWHGATGPTVWLNALQQQWAGGHLLLGAGVLTVRVLAG